MKTTLENAQTSGGKITRRGILAGFTIGATSLGVGRLMLDKAEQNPDTSIAKGVVSNRSGVKTSRVSKLYERLATPAKDWKEVGGKREKNIVGKDGHIYVVHFNNLTSTSTGSMEIRGSKGSSGDEFHISFDERGILTDYKQGILNLTFLEYMNAFPENP